MLHKPTDRRRIKGEASRRLILQAAIACIATQGLSNTTLDRVAEGAGVSRALVIFHFKSKRGLLAEVLDFLGGRYTEGWDVAIAEGGASTMEKLLRLLDYDVGFASEHPEYLSTWYAFWGEANGNSLYHELSFPRDKRYADDVRRLLASLIEEGGYDQSNLTALRMGITAMLFGLWIEAHLNPSPDNYREGMAAVRLFCSNAFPKHQLPPAPARAI